MSSASEKVGIKYSQIISYTGFLIIGLGLILLIPLLSLLFIPQDITLARGFLLPSSVTILAGALIRRAFRPKETVHLTVPDAALIVTAIWVIAILIGALPFILSGALSPINAIFEATSGWTTTGLTMVVPESLPPILLIWRSLMQFVGGAGLAVIMLSAIIGSLGPGIYEAEARTDHILPNVMHTARMIIKIYLSYFLIGAFLYRICGMGTFDATCHAMCGLATGGFSTHTGNIAYWGNFHIEMVSIFLMLIGATNFATHHTILHSRGRKGLLDAEIVLGISLVAVTSLIIIFNLPGENYRANCSPAIFQAVSAISGTGFSTVNLSMWNELPLFAITLLMIAGGGTGSTAGGIKLYRVSIIAKSVLWWVKKQFYPQSAFIQRNILRRGENLEIQDKHIQAVAAFIGIYLATYLTGVMIFMANGFPLKESMFEFASAIGTVGLSTGLTNPDMPLTCKAVQIFGMLLGRLEFIAIFHAFIRIGKDLK